jgi:hypothetical protein
VTCQNGPVGFKTGFVIGAAAGYVLGTRAGRERYQQIVEAAGSIARSDRLHWLTAKGKSGLDLASDRLRATMGERQHPAPGESADTGGHAAP